MTCYAGDGEREMNMFGLTKREQRWKAEQKAAELLVDLARTVIRARTEVEIAEAHTDAAELKRLRSENEKLRVAVAGSRDTHATALEWESDPHNPANY